MATGIFPPSEQLNHLSLQPSKLSIIERKRLPDLVPYSPSAYNLSFCMGKAGYLVSRKAKNDIVVVDWDTGAWVKTLDCTISSTVYTPTAVLDCNNAGGGYVYFAGYNGGTWKLGLFSGDTLTTTGSYAAPSGASDITALCTNKPASTTDLSSQMIYIASNGNTTVYCKTGTQGTTYWSFTYPTGITKITGMAVDRFGTLYVTDGIGNTVWMLNHITGAILGSFQLPCKANGGLSIRDGYLYALDLQRAEVLKVSLGGVALAYNENPLFNFPVHKMFKRKVDYTTLSNGQEPSMLYENGIFKVWHSGLGGVRKAISTNGLDYTDQGLVFAGMCRSCVLKVGSTYHWFGVDTATSKNIWHSTSADSEIWTEPVVVVSEVQFTPFAVNQFGNIGVWYDNGVFKMQCEANSSSGYTGWCLSYGESPDSEVWTFDVAAPNTVNNKTGLTANAGSAVGRARFLYKDANYSWFTAHYNTISGASLPSKIGIFFSPDGKQLYPATGNPLLELDVPHEQDQCADFHMIEARGNIYAIYTARSNYFNSLSGLITAIIPNMTIEQLVKYCSVI